MWILKVSHWWGTDLCLHLNSQKPQNTWTSSHRESIALQPPIPPPWHWHFLHLSPSGCQFSPGATFCSAILFSRDFCSSNTGHGNWVRIHHMHTLCVNCLKLQVGYAALYKFIVYIWFTESHAVLFEIWFLRREFLVNMAQPLFPSTPEHKHRSTRVHVLTGTHKVHSCCANSQSHRIHTHLSNTECPARWGHSWWGDGIWHRSWNRKWMLLCSQLIVLHNFCHG